MYQGYQNRLHHERLARCPLSHEWAVRVAEECHETLKTRGTCYISIIYKYMYPIYIVYICKSKAHGDFQLSFGVRVYICYIYIICILYIRYIPSIYLVYFSHMQSSPICLVYTYFTTNGFIPYLFL